MSNSLGRYNPLRYRGYVYDHETGFYYLQSRYYNPEWGRFLNADAFVSTGQGILGNNMFAYCRNNPVLLKDPDGHLGILASMLIGAAVGIITQYICDVISNAIDGKTGTDIFIPSGTAGEYITAGITGSVCSIPGAGAAVSLASSFVAPALEQGIDYLVYQDAWSWDEYAMDTTSNLVCDVVSGSLSLDCPNYIRDIKDEAHQAGIKGTKRLQAYLEGVQWYTFSCNQLVDASVSAVVSFAEDAYSVLMNCQ